MKNKIDISVIIPMYNASRFIEKAVASVLMQQPHGFIIEIIIVDDVSTDNSCEVVRSIKSDNIKLVELQQNKGTANARNSGIRLAQGEWIQFIDSDDTICNDLYAKFEKSMKPDFNCYLFSLINEFQNYTLIQTITEIKDNRAFGHFGAVWNKFIKKEICIEFSIEILQHEDMAFVVTLMNDKKLRIGLIKDAYYLYNRKNENSKTSKFTIEKYNRMFSCVINQLKGFDELTKMYVLEIFVSLVFDKSKPFTMRLKIAGKTILRLYKYLPNVYLNQNRKYVINAKINLK